MVDRLERLVNLVIALRETRQPLTAEEVRSRVAGYDQSDHTAFRRMFERDKADLRALGVPVETAATDIWGEERGYRIDPRRYDLPELALEADELVALAVAVHATGLSDVAGGGLRKLEVDAGEPGLTTLPEPPPLAVAAAGPQLVALTEAQATRTLVRFSYRPPGRELAVRTVEPHALVLRRGHWYLVGRDRERDTPRSFRLDRISDAPVLVGEPDAFPPPEPVTPEAVLPPAARASGATVEVRAAPEIAWQIARQARGAGVPDAGGWTRFEVPAGDPDALLDWAAEHGPELELLAPAALREQLRTRLAATAAAAAAPPAGAAPPTSASPTVEGGQGPAPPAAPVGTGRRPTDRAAGERPARTLARLERLLTMVPWLLERGGANLEELASRFQAPVAEVTADLDLLGYCGLPGYGGGDLVEVTIADGFVSIRMAEFFRRPLTLSLREGLTLVLAARVLTEAAGPPSAATPERPGLQRALAKLEAALGSAGAPHEAQIRVDLGAPGSEHLPTLRAAIDAAVQVRLAHRAGTRTQTRTRDVDPWAVVAHGGAWYLYGHCHRAGGPRYFRLDRVRTVEQRTEPATAPQQAPPRAPAYEPSADDETVVLDVPRSAAWLAEWLVVDAVEERDDALRIVFRAGSLEWAARLVLRLGPAARVHDPPALRSRVAALAEVAAAHY